MDRNVNLNLNRVFGHSEWLRLQLNCLLRNYKITSCKELTIWGSYRDLTKQNQHSTYNCCIAKTFSKETLLFREQGCKIYCYTVDCLLTDIFVMKTLLLIDNFQSWPFNVRFPISKLLNGHLFMTDNRQLFMAIREKSLRHTILKIL